MNTISNHKRNELWALRLASYPLNCNELIWIRIFIHSFNLIVVKRRRKKNAAKL